MYTNEERKIAGIFHPHHLARIDDADSRNIKFAHYCTAESGVKIITEGSGGMFLRHSSLMNDFSEVQHGLALLVKAYHNHKNYLDRVLARIDMSIPSRIESSGNGLNDLQYNTYLTSISEHDLNDPIESKYGRLSMWRAYARQDGVCLVVNKGPFLRSADAFPAEFATSPVLYLSEDKFNTLFLEIIQSIDRNTDYIKAHISPDQVCALVDDVFRSLVQTTKHPSFSEEKEWRIIYTPGIFGVDPRSSKIPRLNLTLGGVPQVLYKIQFIDYPTEGFYGATIPDLIYQVLIGPSSSSTMTSMAYADILKKLGVPDAGNKIIPTHIPLRT